MPIALRLQDGSVKWKTRPLPEWNIDPAVALGPANPIEMQGAGVPRYFPVLWTVGNMRGQILSGLSFDDGSVLWWKEWGKINPPSAPSFAGLRYVAQGPDGILYISGNTDDDRGWLGAYRPGEPSLRWHYAFPFAEGFTKWGSNTWSHLAGGPVSSRSGRGVYVASANCKVYAFDENGNLRWWYRMRGRPIFWVPQWADGVLYVAAVAPHGVPLGECRHPWDDLELLRKRYHCFGAHVLCGPCACSPEGGPGEILWLYAFLAP